MSKNIIKGKILLVTGGAGFIGSNFIHFVLKKHPDWRVINLDLLTYAGNLENLKEVEGSPRYKFVKGDICDNDLVNRLIKECDVVVHFAAESHVDRSIMDSYAFVKTNVLGTQILLEAARKYNKRFHHISTDEVCGSLGQHDPPFNENTPYNPRNPYASSKAAADHLVRSYFYTYNLPVTISNCSNNYGPFQFPEKFIPLMIINALQEKTLPIYGDGLNVRDWIYVEDHCRAIDLILRKGKIGETYFVSGGIQKQNLEIGKEILKILEKSEDLIQFIKDRPGHDRRYAMDATKIRKELGWKPRYNFEEGLLKTVQWYEENQNWWKNVINKEYLRYYKKQYNKRW